VIGGNNKYAARAPLKALVSAAASLTSPVNASAPWRAKRCSRPASRPTTRTFLPFDSKESAMIDPVFPLAPKITYMVSVETAILSLRLLTFVSPFLKFTDPLRLQGRRSPLYVLISSTYKELKQLLARSTDFPNHVGEGYSIESNLEAVLCFF